MDDIFDGIPALDLSTLIDKNATVKQPTAASTGGRFGIGPIEPEVEVEGEKKGIKTEEELEGVKNPIIGIQEDESEESEETVIDDQKKDDAAIEDSVVKLLASALKEKGLVDYNDEEFRDEDDFIPEVFEKAKTKAVEDKINEYKESLPEEIKSLISNYEDGVPLGQLLESEQRIFEVSSISQEKIKEDSRLQEDIVASYMSNTGWTQTEIDERIKELQDAGLMEKEALRSHTKLIQFEKEQKQAAIIQAQQKKQETIAKQKEQIDSLKKTIFDKKEFFSNVPTNDIEKKTVFEAITKGDKHGRNEITQLLSDPENYIKVAYFLKVLKGDLGKLKTVAKNEVLSTTKKKLETPVRQESRFGKADISTIKNFLKPRN